MRGVRLYYEWMQIRKKNKTKTNVYLPKDEVAKLATFLTILVARIFF